jgi:hypothetical protein
LSEGIELLLVV